MKEHVLYYIIYDSYRKILDRLASMGSRIIFFFTWWHIGKCVNSRLGVTYAKSQSKSRPQNHAHFWTNISHQ